MLAAYCLLIYLRCVRLLDCLYRSWRCLRSGVSYDEGVGRLVSRAPVQTVCSPMQYMIMSAYPFNLAAIKGVLLPSPALFTAANGLYVTSQDERRYAIDSFFFQ